MVTTSALLLISCGNSVVDKPYNQGINITPTPLELTQNAGTFTLSKNVKFVSQSEDVDKVAVYFASKIKSSTGFDLALAKEKPSSNYINLEIAGDIDVNDEGYLLEVTPNGIELRAKTPQGIFYGLQTVMQLLPAEIESPTLVKQIAWTMPAVTIKDEPRFKYRGHMLDVCRHFSTVEDIKKRLDVMAMFKINTFHWHLTDDQGWRIEIKKYPKLAEISAKRYEGDGTQYGPFFFTQEEVKEVVAYAEERFIEVIPEIELPGHGVAALTAYPEFSCTGGPFEVRNIWGVSNDIYCAGNEETFKFLEDVITEVVPLFKSQYFHIGGDEAPKGRWEKCPKCQARIKALGIKGDKEHSAEEKLQSYFVQRIEKVLLAHGKKMIGWDEILEGGLAPTATVMSWRGESGGIAAANMGHDVIMTPSPWLYIDAFQGDEVLSPVGIGSKIPLSKIYGYDPLPEKLDTDKQHHILGVQANLWCEYLQNEDMKEYFTFPRLLALSEIAWSDLNRKNYDDFVRRLDNQRVRLDMHDINYYIPLPEQKDVPSCNFVAFTDSVKLEFTTTEPVTIVYTTDGSEPNAQSAVYSEALTFTESTTLKLRSILVSGKQSAVRTITIEKQSFAPAVEKSKEAKKGLKAEYYKGKAFKVSDLEGQTPEEVEFIGSLRDAKHRVPDYREVYPEDFYSTVITGYINIPEDDVYYFKTVAHELWIDDQLFISNEGKVVKQSHNDKSIALAKGPHKIKIVRLSGIVGGWPPQWDSIYLMLRRSGEAKFSFTGPDYYKY